MEMVILNSADFGRLTLTNVASGGELVLRQVQHEVQKDFQPWDTFEGDRSHTPISAAFIVHSWACDPCRTQEGIAAAREYLRQWPEGPQAELADIQIVQIRRRAMEDAARDLAIESPPLDELSIIDRCILIRKMAERLKEFKADSLHAYILRMRIAAAASLIQVDHQVERRQKTHTG